MNRCYLFEIASGEIKYSCAERNYNKAENFGLKYLLGDWVIIVSESREKAIEEYNKKWSK